MIDCKNCLHSGLCMHEDKAEEYIRQHKSMRDKCSLFDGEPTCNRFVDNKVLEGNKSLKECIERQQKTINELHRKIKENSDKDIFDKYRNGSKPKIYTCQDKDIPKVTYSDQYEDERTITKDDDISFSMTGGDDSKYFINNKTVLQKEYEEELLNFIDKFGLPVW